MIKVSVCQHRRHKRWESNHYVRRSPGVGDAMRSRILAWELPWTEEPGGLISLKKIKNYKYKKKYDSINVVSFEMLNGTFEIQFCNYYSKFSPSLTHIRTVLSGFFLGIYLWDNISSSCTVHRSFFYFNF